MWQNGIYQGPYRPGLSEKGGRLFGTLIGMCIPYLPYLFVALLLYTPGPKDAGNTLWNATVVLLLAALFFLVERGISTGLRRLGEHHIAAKVGFWLFVTASLVLQIWCVQAGTAMLLRHWSGGHACSLLAAAFVTPFVAVRWFYTLSRQTH
jgi:hypothetical protein